MISLRKVIPLFIFGLSITLMQNNDIFSMDNHSHRKEQASEAVDISIKKHKPQIFIEITSCIRFLKSLILQNEQNAQYAAYLKFKPLIISKFKSAAKKIITDIEIFLITDCSSKAVAFTRALKNKMEKEYAEALEFELANIDGGFIETTNTEFLAVLRMIINKQAAPMQQALYANLTPFIKEYFGAEANNFSLE